MTNLDTYNKITGREKEYLGHLSDGLSYAEINKKMEIAKATGDIYRLSLRRKTGLKTPVALARFYDKYLRKYNDNSAV